MFSEVSYFFISLLSVDVPVAFSVNGFDLNFRYFALILLKERK